VEEIEDTNEDAKDRGFLFICSFAILS